MVSFKTTKSNTFSVKTRCSVTGNTIKGKYIVQRVQNVSFQANVTDQGDVLIQTIFMLINGVTHGSILGPILFPL